MNRTIRTNGICLLLKTGELTNLHEVIKKFYGYYSIITMHGGNGSLFSATKGICKLVSYKMTK